MGVVDGRGRATRLSILCRGGDPPIQNRPSSVCLRAACAHHDGRNAFQLHIPVPTVFIYIYTRAIHLFSFSPLSLSLSVCVYLRVEIRVRIYAHIYAYIRVYGWEDGVGGGQRVERDGNASDEIRGTRVPRVTRGQLDSRPFKRDYVQRRPSLLAPPSLSFYLWVFSFFARARGEEKGVFFDFRRISMDGFWSRFIVQLFLMVFLFFGGQGIMFFRLIYLKRYRSFLVKIFLCR